MRILRLSLLLFTPLFFSVAVADGVTLPNAERVVLDNGTVLILNENHDVPLIGLQAVVRGGAVADPADKHGLANLLAGLLEKGAGDRSSGEFAEAVREVCGVEAPVEYGPRPVDDPERRRPDISRAREVLGWEPTIELREGLRRSLPDFAARLGGGVV